MMTPVTCPGCGEQIWCDPEGTTACGSEDALPCCALGADGSTLCEEHGLVHGERSDVENAHARAVSHMERVAAAMDAARTPTRQTALGLFAALIELGVTLDPDEDLAAIVARNGAPQFSSAEAGALESLLVAIKGDLGELEMLRVLIAAYHDRPPVHGA